MAEKGTVFVCDVTLHQQNIERHLHEKGFPQSAIDHLRCINKVEIYAVCGEMYVFTYIHIYVHEIICEPRFYVPFICLFLPFPPSFQQPLRS